MAKTSDIQKDLGALKSDVDKLRAHTAELVTKVGNQTVDIVKNATEAGKEGVDNAICNSKKACKNAAKTMEKNPIATVAGALGLGVILGGIVKRILRKKR